MTDIAALAWLVVRKSTKPNPILRACPGRFGSIFVLTLAERNPVTGSKASFNRAVVVAKFRLRTKSVEDGALTWGSVASFDFGMLSWAGFDGLTSSESRAAC